MNNKNPSEEQLVHKLLCAKCKTCQREASACICDGFDELLKKAAKETQSREARHELEVLMATRFLGKFDIERDKTSSGLEKIIVPG